MRKGWYEKMSKQVNEEVEHWPAWMKKEAGFKEKDMSEDIIVQGVKLTQHPEPTQITFYLRDGAPAIEIKPDGFYIRGEKVPQDENESRAMFEAFRAFLKAAGYWPIKVL